WGAEPVKADFREANLWGAYLEGAYLLKANLWGAYLEGAYLLKANLWGAYLVEASLREANLREANLERANLERANLWGAIELNPKQIKSACNWQNATFSKEFKQKLDREPDQKVDCSLWDY
ncbi:MAG: pentapeptide repeat-containing protein, partial [Waterburya sp.]